MESHKLKHLDFIQSVITRMNTNSFQIKGMTITIVSALLAVYASTSKLPFLMIGIIPTFLFWFLDAYYLQQERKFRGVYNNAAGLKSDIEISDFEMPIQKFNGGSYSFSKVLFSKTIVWLYGTIIVLLVAINCFLVFSNCTITINCN